MIPNHATRCLERRLGDVVLCSVEACVLALQETLRDGNARGASGWLAFTKVALAEIRPWLQEAEAERCLVARRVTDLEWLQERTERLANAAMVCCAIAIEEAGASAVEDADREALQRCLHFCGEDGMDLEGSLERCFEALRASALALSATLRGNPAHCGNRRIADVSAHFHNSFCVVRASILDRGLMMQLLNPGLEKLWMAVFCLEDFLAEFVLLEAVTSGA